MIMMGLGLMDGMAQPEWEDVSVDDESDVDFDGGHGGRKHLWVGPISGCQQFRRSSGQESARMAKDGDLYFRNQQVLYEIIQ